MSLLCNIFDLFLSPWIRIRNTAYLIKYCDEDYAVKSPFHAEFRSVGIFENFKDMNECVLFFNSASPQCVAFLCGKNTTFTWSQCC